MQHKSIKYLHDILNAIRELDEISILVNKNFLEYKKNLTVKRAVEREFEIIGEALNKALKEDPTLNFSDIKKLSVFEIILSTRMTVFKMKLFGVF